MSEVVQIITTTANREEASEIARQLVQRRLAACVQVFGPLQSTYRWKGEVETAEEWLCVIKTLRSQYGQIQQAIFELHSYEEPEILVVPVVQGSAGYLQWLSEQVQSIEPQR